MANQNQAHTAGTASSFGSGMKLRETQSLRKSKKLKEDSILDLNMDLESNGKLTRENDAAALLLGLAHSIGSPASLQETREATGRGRDFPKSFDSEDRMTSTIPDDSERVSKSSQIDPSAMKLLTAKGHGRLGPGDNRVRPPKAATKFLNTKWRHIRLPNVQAALEAEDWVVMYGHLMNPEALSKDKMNTMLNFHPSHYNENAVNKELGSLRDANELEHFLKDRYSVTAQKKSRASHKSLPAAKLARNNSASLKGVKRNITEAYSMPNMRNNSTSLTPHIASLEAVKSGVPLYTNSPMCNQPNDNNKSKGDEISMDVRGRFSFPQSGGSKVGSVGSDPIDSQTLLMQNYGGLPWQMLQNPSTVTDGTRNHELSRAVSQSPRSPINRAGLPVRPFQQGKAGNLLPADSQINNDLNKKPKMQLHDEATNEDFRAEGAANIDSDTVSPEGGIFKPGRPPSYDEMVRWCVDLKRMLFQKKVNLTIEGAINMVNDPSIYACGPKTAHTKSLVPSTLRKRVLGIYGITWSQIATAADKDVNKKIDDKAIVFAADMLDKYGLNSSGRLAFAQVDKEESSNLSEHSNSRNTSNEQSTGDVHTGSGMERDKCSPGQSQHLTDDEMNNSIPMGTQRLKTTMSGISDSVRDIIEKAETQFLNFEEVAMIIKNATQGKLPVSLQVNYRPKSGTLYLINRSKVVRFRCDGYDFKKKETHARKMLSSNERLNCYYAGGTKDSMHRRCYWMISDDCEASGDPSEIRPKDLVLMHYMKNCGWSGEPNADMVLEKESFPSKENLMKQKEELEQKIAELNELLSR